MIGEFARVDQQRLARTGFAEVVFGAGKTAEQVRHLDRLFRTAQAQASGAAGH